MTPEEFEAFEKSACEIKGIEPWQAYILALLEDGELNPDGFPSVKKWVAQCYNEPWDCERRMEAANEIIGGHGVEGLGFVDDCAYGKASYVNLGDTYDTTLLYDHGEDEFVVCSWGSWYESKEAEAAEEETDDDLISTGSD